MVASTDDLTFARGAEQFRRELLAHCYRMLGSVDEAEDLVQETYLRAWRSYATFEERSSLRVWLYRIATNACLNAIEQRGRRAVPWPEPFPDTLMAPQSPDPATVVTAHEDLRLALVTSLQHLSPRQRAVLILREVLSFPAAEVAAMLDTTVAAVKSSLQRARARLAELDPPRQRLDEPTEPQARELLELYIAGFEKADTVALERALRTDAEIALVGTDTWFRGRETCLRFLTNVIGSPGDWRMIPISANGQPAAAAYQRHDDIHRAFGIGVLTATATGITRITVFDGGSGLVSRFGLPTEI